MPQSSCSLMSMRAEREDKKRWRTQDRISSELWPGLKVARQIPFPVVKKGNPLTLTRNSATAAFFRQGKRVIFAQCPLPVSLAFPVVATADRPASPKVVVIHTRTNIPKQTLCAIAAQLHRCRSQRCLLPQRAPAHNYFLRALPVSAFALCWPRMNGGKGVEVSRGVPASCSGRGLGQGKNIERRKSSRSGEEDPED